MATTTGQTKSVWMIPNLEPPEAALGHDLQADVCIVGAGIAGMSTAFLLARRGKSVVILDDGGIDGGQTARTTAHLANAIDDRYFQIEKYHGEDGARLAAESHTQAIETIQSIVADENIDCDFERLNGYLFLPPGESEDILDRELEAAHRAGLADVKRLPQAPLPGFSTGPCLCFPRQGQFHPLKYLAGLARGIQRRGGRFHVPAHVTKISGGRPARVELADGPVVTADAVVVATNIPINNRVVIQTKLAAYLSYAIAGTVSRGAVPKALFWDTADPYHYVRLQSADSPGDELLIVGGEDHRTGQAADAAERYGRLEQWARERFPIKQVTHRWSGQVVETPDGLAFIGHNPRDEDNIFIATGDSGMGMTHGTIAGILLTDLIMGQSNPWAALYDPSRKSVRAAKEYLRENLVTAGQYGSWFTAGEVSSVDEIPAGSGALIRHGLTKHAVYRDPEGCCHVFGAACPHLGCIVKWNDNEHTWDCPCHGSRFDHLGHVINGPANTDLQPEDESSVTGQEELAEAGR